MSEPSVFAPYKAMDTKWTGPKLVGLGVLAVVLALIGIFTAASISPLN